MKNGFSLISFMVYCTILSLLACLIYTTTTTLFIPSILDARRCQIYVSLHSAMDAFVHDVRMLTHNKHVLKHVHSDMLVWSGTQSNEYQDIGWRITVNTIERIEGIFNGTEWLVHQSHCIISDVHNASFAIQDNSLIKCTYAHVSNLNYKVEGYVCINS